MPWERLQEGPDESFTDDLDADVLLSDGRSSRPLSSWCPTAILHNVAASRHRYWILFFLTTLLVVSLLPIILVLQSHKGGTPLVVTGHPVRIPPGTVTPSPFLDPLEFDTNGTEGSIRSFSPPEFSPILDFIYDYFSLVQSTELDTPRNATAQNVSLEVTVYYESLSIPSRLFLAHLFFPTYFKAGRGWSAKLIPWGHAEFVPGKVNGTERVKCENKKDECEGNLVQACAIRHTTWNDTRSVERLMRYVKCLMADTGKGGSVLVMGQDSTGTDCARMVGLDWDPIYKCTKSGDGLLILHKFKERTEAVLRSGKGAGYPLPVVEVKGYGVISEEDKKQFPHFIQTRLDLLLKESKTEA